MWKRGGRSSALDRAQALLSARRTSKGDARGSALDFTAKSQGSSGSFKNRPASPNPHTLLSALGELSSDSAESEHGDDDDDDDDGRSANAANKYGEKLDSNKSSLGGRSRFLKASSTSNSQSAGSRKQTEQEFEPRHVSSSQSCKQVLEQVRQRTSLTATQSSTELSQRGNRFLKKATERSTISPAEAPRSRTAGIRSKSRAADPAKPGGLEMKSMRLMSAVSLESDEEDMRKLLGDSMDSPDSSFSEARRPSSTKRLDKMLSHPRVCSTASPAAPRPSSHSNTAPPRSPASPSHRSSPFRFTGQARAHFSPSVLSPSPSPPLPQPSPPTRPGSFPRAGSPQRSLSASSEQGGALSPEECFPLDSEDPHSDTSSVASEDFKINVMTVDELAPAFDGFSEETSEKQTKPADPDPDPGFLNQQLNQEEKQEEEEVLDYQSDFESDSSSSQVSEHLAGHWEEEDAPSEVSVEASHPDVSHKTEDGSDRSLSGTSRSSDPSYRSDSSSRESRSSTLHSSSGSSRRRRRRASSRKTVKDSAAQTQPDPLSDPWSAGQSGHTRARILAPPAHVPGVASLDPTVAMIYMNPGQMVTRMLGAERLEAISTFDPAVFALNEMLKQQLSVTRRFMESSHHLHSCLLQSLEPPSYRYTMLEDSIQNTHKRRRPKLSME